MPLNYAKMCFCNDEYLKLTFSIAVFVAWYMGLFLLYFLVSPSVLEVGNDWWFLTCMSRRISSAFEKSKHLKTASHIGFQEQKLLTGKKLASRLD